MSNIKQQDENLNVFQQIDVLTQAGIIPSNTPPEQVAVFAETCKRHKLDPIAKQAYLVSYYSKKESRRIYHTIVGINGQRIIAARSGLHAGTDDVLFDGMPMEDALSKFKRDGVVPSTARCTVKKVVGGVVCDFTATIKISEYNTKQQLWASHPFAMASKVAEACALRKAFPAELGDFYIEEEVQISKTNGDEEEKKEKNKVAEKSNAATEAAMAAIKKQQNKPPVKTETIEEAEEVDNNELPFD